MGNGNWMCRFSMGLSFILFVFSPGSKVRCLSICSKTTPSRIFERKAGGNLLDCRIGWRAFDKYCYRFTSTHRTWQESKDMCEGKHSSLLVLQDKKELTWIMKQIAPMQHSSTWWMGLSGVDPSKHWKRSVVPTNYDLALAEEPDSVKGKDDCVMISNRGFLRDVDCSRYMAFICKSKKMKDNSCDASMHFFSISTNTSDHCYWLSNFFTTWNQAHDSCLGMHKGKVNVDLLSIESDQESSQVLELIKEDVLYHAGFWTGLNDQLNPGIYQFSDGKPYKKENVNWLTTDAIVTAEDCWVLLPSGKATVYPCTTEMSPICKHSREPKKDNSCPNYWSRFGESCYYVGDVYEDWNTASDKCTSLGAQLLKVESSKEKLWLETNFTQIQEQYMYWSGLNANAAKNVYVWNDGTKLDNKMIKWDKFSRDLSRCMSWDGFGSLASAKRCSYTVPSLACEYTRKSTTTPCLKGWVSHDSKCYHIESNSTIYTWSDNKKACQELGKMSPNSDDIVFNYITIEDKSQLNFVKISMSTLLIKNRLIWFGLNNQDNVDKWVWDGAPKVSSKTVSFYDKKQPDLHHKCVVIKRSGSYSTHSCSAPAPFICEKNVHGRADDNILSKICLFVMALCLLFNSF